MKHWVFREDVSIIAFPVKSAYVGLAARVSLPYLFLYDTYFTLSSVSALLFPAISFYFFRHIKSTGLPFGAFCLSAIVVTENM